MKVLLMLLIGSTVNALTIKDSLSQNWYYVLYKSNHSECQRVSEELMKCPTNALDQPETYEKETARDLAYWDLFNGCVNISAIDDIHICAK